MKRLLLLTAILGFGCLTALSQSVDKSKRMGRACVGIVNTANGDEEVWRAASTAGRNQKIVAHLDATMACEALVSPFLKSGQFPPAWLPQYVDLSPGKETLLPAKPVSWSWEKDTGPLEIFVLFFPPNCLLLSYYLIISGILECIDAGSS